MLRAVAAFVAVLAISGCGAKVFGGEKRSQSSASPAIVTVEPVSGAVGVNPSAPIKVAASGGLLSAVTFTNADGKKLKGELAADKSSWASAELLGYGRTYSLTATARNAAGTDTLQESTFTTVQPGELTNPFLNSQAGTSLRAGATYGVGEVVVVHFDEAIGDRKAAQESLTVTSVPTQEGAWNWTSDQDVRWRPKVFWKSGTKVTVNAKVYGKQVGQDLYGQQDQTISFKIGASHISVADDKNKLVQVFHNGKLRRVMPTSMGKGGTDVIKGRSISYWTQRGTYTVLDKGNPVRMNSASYGLPLDKGGYSALIKWATRISMDGVFLHQLDSTVAAQGHTNLSHGCLNLSGANAKWFFQNSVAGDVVQVKNTGGAPLELWQNGDWSVSWGEWVGGGAK